MLYEMTHGHAFCVEFISAWMVDAQKTKVHQAVGICFCAIKLLPGGIRAGRPWAHSAYSPCGKLWWTLVGASAFTTTKVADNIATPWAVKTIRILCMISSRPQSVWKSLHKNWPQRFSLVSGFLDQHCSGLLIYKIGIGNFYTCPTAIP